MMNRLESFRFGEITIRLVLWILTLVLPMLLWFPASADENLIVLSPTWAQIQYVDSYTFDPFSQVTVGYVLVFRLYAYVQSVLAIADPSALFFTLLPGFPILLGLIMIELQNHYSWSPNHLPYFILWYPFALMLAAMFLTIIGYTLSLIPIPVASIFQYLRYRQTRHRYTAKKGVKRSKESQGEIKALRGGEFVGNRLRFKVKVVNDGTTVITDLVITVVSYPKDALKLEGEQTTSIAKIEPHGFRSPTFDFLPMRDCVKGNITASVSYVDSEGNAHSMMTDPYVIRAVCDLLRPESISPEEFMLKLTTMDHGEMSARVEDWTPEDMHTKSLQVLKNSNFFEVTSSSEEIGDNICYTIKGWARGIYTNKSLGIEIEISGQPECRGAICKLIMSGEDEAMIMPAIDEIAQKLAAWLCPVCGGNLPMNLVNELKAAKSIACPFCGTTIDR